ncbi:hypothetical protein Y696_10495 [Mesotoga sp. H07pep.5.4]|jgi:hypothetical protein|nr:hypothetical protein Y696_10495 [Mesotoga sp. H07pep.5.4]
MKIIDRQYTLKCNNQVIRVSPSAYYEALTFQFPWRPNTFLESSDPEHDHFSDEVGRSNQISLICVLFGLLFFKQLTTCILELAAVRTFHAIDRDACQKHAASYSKQR